MLTALNKFQVGDQVVVVGNSTLGRHGHGMPCITKLMVGREFTVSSVHASTGMYGYLYRFEEKPDELGNIFGVPEEFLMLIDQPGIDDTIDSMLV